MRIQYPKLYNMTHLLALNVLLLRKDLTIILIHYINTLKQELDGTRVYKETDSDEISVVYVHINELPVKFSVCVNEDEDKLPPMYWLP